MRLTVGRPQKGKAGGMCLHAVGVAHFHGIWKAACCAIRHGYKGQVIQFKPDSCSKLTTEIYAPQQFQAHTCFHKQAVQVCT